VAALVERDHAVFAGHFLTDFFPDALRLGEAVQQNQRVLGADIAPFLVLELQAVGLD
jgi:hypothetical protein